MSKHGSRSVGYSKEEDKLLCQVYMKISQNRVTGVYRTADQFWDRVVEAFRNEKNETWSERSKKSIQCRFQTIERATKRFHVCIKQCENKRLNGDDICNHAKEMLMEDPKFKSGWKFDHVWNIIKNSKKFKDDVTHAKNISNPSGFGSTSSESENPTSDSGTQTSPSLSTFSINLSDEDDIIAGSLSQRSNGVKRSKLKRKNDDRTSAVIKTLEERSIQILEQLKKTNAQRQHHLKIQCKNYALKEFKEENKILLQDLNSIQDPHICAYVQGEQTRILRKRINQQALSASTSIKGYLNDIHGSGSDLFHN